MHVYSPAGSSLLVFSFSAFAGPGFGLGGETDSAVFLSEIEK